MSSSKSLSKATIISSVYLWYNLSFVMLELLKMFFLMHSKLND